MHNEMYVRRQNTLHAAYRANNTLRPHYSRWKSRADVGRRRAKRSDWFPPMPSLEHILLQLMHLALRPSSAHSAVSCAPLGDMAATALAGLSHAPPPDSSDLSAAAVADWAAHLLSQRAAQPAQSPALDHHLAVATDALDAATALALASESSVFAQARIQISSPAVFDYITMLEIEPQPNDPFVVLVGRVPPSTGQLGVKLPRYHRQLRNIALSYAVGHSYPALDVWLPSRSSSTGMHINRMGWPQRDDADTRLELFTHSMRPFGQVFTARIVPPWNMEGRRLHVSIPAEAGVMLVVTQVVNSAGHALAQIVKVESDGANK